MHPAKKEGNKLSSLLASKVPESTRKLLEKSLQKGLRGEGDQTHNVTKIEVQRLYRNSNTYTGVTINQCIHVYPASCNNTTL